MPEATLRDRAKRLLTASGRSDVPPFMVMDVMAAAARIEAAGGHVIHMEVGQPAAAAPKAAIAAAHAALEGGLIDTSSETRHALTGEALLAAHRRTPLKGVLVGSPANPTGTMMSREALTSL